jgi:hypothetical protein
MIDNLEFENLSTGISSTCDGACNSITASPSPYTQFFVRVGTDPLRIRRVGVAASPEKPSNAPEHRRRMDMWGLRRTWWNFDLVLSGQPEPEIDATIGRSVAWKHFANEELPEIEYLLSPAPKPVDPLRIEILSFFTLSKGSERTPLLAFTDPEKPRVRYRNFGQRLLLELPLCSGLAPGT